MVSALTVEAKASSWAVTLSGKFSDDDVVDVNGVFNNWAEENTFSETITMNTDPTKWGESASDENFSSLYGAGPAATVTLTLNGKTFASTVIPAFGYQILNTGEPGRTYLKSYFGAFDQGGQQLSAGNQAYVDTILNWNVSQTITQHLQPVNGMSASLYLVNEFGTQIGFSAMPDEIRVVINAVPEPQTYAMFLAGLASVAFVARRRKKKACILDQRAYSGSRQ